LIVNLTPRVSYNRSFAYCLSCLMRLVKSLVFFSFLLFCFFILFFFCQCYVLFNASRWFDTHLISDPSLSEVLVCVPFNKLFVYIFGWHNKERYMNNTDQLFIFLSFLSLTFDPFKQQNYSQHSKAQERLNQVWCNKMPLRLNSYTKKWFDIKVINTVCEWLSSISNEVTWCDAQVYFVFVSRNVILQTIWRISKPPNTDYLHENYYNKLVEHIQRYNSLSARLQKMNILGANSIIVFWLEVGRKISKNAILILLLCMYFTD